MFISIHQPYQPYLAGGVPLDSTTSASQTRIATKTLGRDGRVPGRDQTTDLHGIYMGFT